MDTQTSRFETILRQASCKLTPPRQQVFAYLRSSPPVTMHELTAALPTIDRASIYRTVQLFESHGIVKRLQIGWKYKLELGDLFSAHHHHLTCTTCGAVESFDEPPELVNALRAISLKNSFAASSHVLEINGLCRRCQMSA